MNILEFAITYIIITALWLLLSWLFCSLVDRITTMIKTNQTKQYNRQATKVNRVV